MYNLAKEKFTHGPPLGKNSAIVLKSEIGYEALTESKKGYRCPGFMNEDGAGESGCESSDEFDYAHLDYD